MCLPFSFISFNLFCGNFISNFKKILWCSEGKIQDETNMQLKKNVYEETRANNIYKKKYLNIALNWSYLLKHKIR